MQKKKKKDRHTQEQNQQQQQQKFLVNTYTKPNHVCMHDEKDRVLSVCYVPGTLVDPVNKLS